MSSIGNSLQKAFNIEAGEGYRVFYLLLQSFFIGIFIGVFEVGATGIFLNVYPETMIPKAYLISGMAGILFTSVYSSLQSRMKFTRLTTYNLLFIVLMTISLRFGFKYINEKLLAFALIVFMGPLKINAIVGYNGTVVRMFTLRQGKRLFGLVDSGLILGLILSGYSVSLLMGLNFSSMNLFYICAASLLLAIILQFVIAKKYNLEVSDRGEDKNKTKESSIINLVKNKYVRLMAIFVVLSILTLFFLHYSFLGVLNSNYPDNRELTIFLGAFMSTMYVFTILIKSFVYSKFIKAYGLKSTLIISSIVLILFTLIASIIGSFFGFAKEAGSFTFFFLVIALSRLFVQTFKDAFEVPSFKLLYQSLSIRIRHAVQAGIDGTINEFAAVFSGLLLTILVFLTFVKLIHFSYVLLIILTIWVIVAIRLYKEYRMTLERSLAAAKQTDSTDSISSISNNQSILHESITSGPPQQILRTLQFIKNTEPAFYNHALVKALESSHSEVKKYALSELQNFKDIFVADKIDKKLNHLREEESKKTAKEIISTIYKEIKEISEEQILHLAKSRDEHERIKAINTIAKSKNSVFLSTYNILLRDLNHEVRLTAIINAPETEFIEVIPILIDYLASPKYYSYAYNAILEYGENAYENLEHSFYKTGMEDKVVIRIVRLISQIKNDKASTFLLSKIDHYNRDIVKECVEGLQGNTFEPDVHTFIPIQQAITKVISIAAWNYSAKYSIEPDRINLNLAEAIEEEIQDTHNLLFALLSLAYDAKSISHVRENLESGTAESANFAIELLDIFIAEELKPTLFPLLEDTPLADKIRQLQYEFPIEKMDTQTLLLSIINRDCNHINMYTKFCAIVNLYNLPDFTVNNDIIAQLFNPHKLLHQSAACYIQKNNPALLQNVENRIGEKIRTSIESAINMLNRTDYHLLSSKLEFLKQHTCFSSLTGKKLIILAEIIEDITIKKDEEYPIKTETDAAGFCMIVEGSVKFISSDASQLFELVKNQFLNLYALKEIHEYTLKAMEDSYIYIINQELLNEIMFDHHDINIIILENTKKEFSFHVKT